MYAYASMYILFLIRGSAAATLKWSDEKKREKMAGQTDRERRKQFSRGKQLCKNPT